MKRFAALDVGSYELTMKIFEISEKSGFREIDRICHQIDLGTETYAMGKISHTHVDDLCRLLKEYSDVMKGYKVDDYKAYGTSAIREASNMAVVLDQIKQRSGIKVEVLSNSEQRFLDYKSTASKGAEFEAIIKKSSAILDIGGGSIQISLFNNSRLNATSNIRMGVLRVQDALHRLDVARSRREELVREMVNPELEVFKNFFAGKKSPGTVIIFDDYLSVIVQKKFGRSSNDQFEREVLSDILYELENTVPSEYAKRYAFPEENVSLLQISAVMCERVMELLGAEHMWIPGVSLADGIAYDYAQENGLLKQEHDFDKDILECTENIARRYNCNKKRADNLEKLSLQIFDSMRKEHGLSKRERLLLQLAARLSDCGRYVSLLNMGESAYSIIMATEIIGLSHKERKMTANIVKYNHLDFAYNSGLEQEYLNDRHAYLTIAKLVAILKVANGLDRSQQQKFDKVKADVKGSELIITVDTSKDITLEKGLFEHRANFFEEIFSIRPVIKQKKP